MNLEYQLESTKEGFFLRLQNEMKKFNSCSYYPITLKKYPNYFIITTNSILTRGLNSYFKASITEELPFVKIKGSLRMSLIGRIMIFSFVAVVLSMVISMNFDVKVLFLCCLAGIVIYCKHLYERNSFKKFLIAFFEGFEKNLIEKQRC